MNIETKIQVSYETTIGDSFDEGMDKRDMEDLILNHIKDWCAERGLDTKDIKATILWGEK